MLALFRGERQPTLLELENAYVLDVNDAEPTKTRAAEVLGIDRRTLYRLLGRRGGSGGVLHGKGARR